MLSGRGRGREQGRGRGRGRGRARVRGAGYGDVGMEFRPPKIVHHDPNDSAELPDLDEHRGLDETSTSTGDYNSSKW